jgi:hypothetical protein
MCWASTNGNMEVGSSRPRDYTKGEAQMAEQRPPDLEQMDEQQAHRLLAELFSLLSIEAEDRIRHESYTMEWPQSGERLRSRQKMREFQEANAGSRPPGDCAACW